MLISEVISYEDELKKKISDYLNLSITNLLQINTKSRLNSHKLNC